MFVRALWRVGVAALVTVPAAPSLAQTRTGTYEGTDGGVLRVQGLGFSPSFVLVKAEAPYRAVARSSTMVGDASKLLHTAFALDAGMVVSLDMDGFTLGPQPEVNAPGIPYYWFASASLPGASATGTYQGDGTSPRAIDIGFPPDVVVMMPQEAVDPTWWTSLMDAGTDAMYLNSQGLLPNDVIGVWDAGFLLGSGANVNTTGNTYHFAAWRAATTHLVVGQYVGNGADAGWVDAGLGFPTGYVILKGDGHAGVHRPNSLLNPADSSLYFQPADSIPGAITALGNGGFTIGPAAQANEAGTYYWWAAWSAENLGDAGVVVGGSGGKDRVACDCATGGYEPTLLLIALALLLASARRTARHRLG